MRSPSLAFTENAASYWPYARITNLHGSSLEQDTDFTLRHRVAWYFGISKARTVSRPLRSVQSTIAWVVLLISAPTGMGFAVTEEAHLDAARQLVRLTIVENALRTDTEQAARQADALPAELPMSLRTEIRNI